MRREIIFEKAIVIGCPGAGKSTFAKKLRDYSGLPLFYLDLLCMSARLKSGWQPVRRYFCWTIRLKYV